MQLFKSYVTTPGNRIHLLCVTITVIFDYFLMISISLTPYLTVSVGFELTDLKIKFSHLYPSCLFVTL